MADPQKIIFREWLIREKNNFQKMADPQKKGMADP